MAAPCYHAQSNIPTISADVTVTPSVDGSRFVVAAPVTTRTITLDTTNSQPGESVSFTVIAVNGTADVFFQDSGATERGRIAGLGNGGAITFTYIGGVGWRATSWSGDGDITL